MAKLKLLGTIEKWEAQADGSVIISGVASSETQDSQGEIVKADAMREAIPGFMRWANVREMHQNSAVGKALSCFVGEDSKTHITAKIIDTEAVKKVVGDVYKAFSIGGRALAKSGNAITRLILNEISIVDRPANPENTFEIAKAERVDDIPKEFETDKTMTPENLAKLEVLPDLITKLTERIDALEKRPMPAAPDLSKVEASIAKLEGAITATQAATEMNMRNDVIAKMAREGRAPVNPETSVAYKQDELQKLDLGTLKMLSVNAPVLPLNSRATIAKSDGKSLDVSKLTGEAKTAAVWEDRYPNAASVPNH